ncbi:hypothetical protein LWC35_19255 [Pseudonocardia kujensis]|uniref:TetR/AcrR family transcriptional regulator n=1 Tax=Pseudonocardia kujensis TaxID=1128675 RepID=UPI001E50A57C|nr:TetR/AcrR family transcriptional regulator [Pseudonocardia kujensis]MCE0765020.1 hypothetical protein [Pseudonocardia kujensis]
MATHSIDGGGGVRRRGHLGSGLRKLPLQERSKAMIARVLDTARELVEEIGYEAVAGSPTLLLEQSGVSRGSFYAFFESPERVLDELSCETLENSLESLRHALAHRPGDQWAEICDVLIDLYVAEHRTPLIRELWVRQNLTQRVRALDELFIDDMAELVWIEFKKHSPLFEDLTTLQCRAALHALERLMQFAFLHDQQGDSAIVTEAEQMLLRYFAGHSGS